MKHVKIVDDISWRFVIRRCQFFLFEHRYLELITNYVSGAWKLMLSTAIIQLAQAKVSGLKRAIFPHNITDYGTNKNLKT